MEFIKLKRKHRKAKEWQALARQWYDSGETQKAFCLRHGIQPKTFSKWAVERQQEQAALSRRNKVAEDLAITSVQAPLSTNNYITLCKDNVKISLPLSVCPKLLDRILLRLHALS